MSYPTVRSNSGITDPVTLFDFVPFGVALEIESTSKTMFLPQTDGWTASNWMPYGMATDGTNWLLFHSTITISAFEMRFAFNNQKVAVDFAGRPHYDDTGLIFPYPTVYSNPSNKYFMAHAYDETTRTWYFKIIRSADRVVIIDVEGKARSIPLWVGKAGGSYLGMGISSDVDALECWGGYLDFCDLTKCIFTHPVTQQVYNLPYGKMSIDREYHRTCQGVKAAGTPLEYSAMELRTMQGEKIDFLFIEGRNPLPPEMAANYPELMKFGRINFVSRGVSYRVDEYTYSDNGWNYDQDGNLFPPTQFNISANFGEGIIDLVATPLMTEDSGYWNLTGYSGNKTWWDPDCYFTRGRVYIKWNGTITLKGNTITITDEPSIAELNKYIQKNTTPAPSPTNPGVWLLFLGFLAVAATSKR